MNTHDSSISIQDPEFLYVENFVRLGDGNLRTLWDVGTAVYTAPGGLTIVYFLHFTIGPKYYCAIFLSDGSAIQLDMATLAQTTIGSAKTFYDATTGNLPCAKQWGSTYLIISNNNTVNDYWAWDGTLLYGAGTVAVDGLTLLSAGQNYSSRPNITPIGGSGTGLVVQANVQNAVVASLKITNPGTGYKPGDLVQLKFSGGGSETTPVITANLVGIGAAGSTGTPPGIGGVVMLSGGSGYTVAPGVNFIGGGGVGAVGVAQISGGAVVNVSITTKGSGYTSLPAVQFTGGGGGSGAVGQAVFQPSTVSTLTIVDGGTGFFGNPPILTIVGGGGTGATATCTIAAGVINGTTVTAGGINYTSPPTVLVSPGSNASAYATLTVMPWGVSGSAMETYLSRVWLVNPARAVYATLPPGVQYSGSAPGSVSNFAASAGGVAAVSADSFLQTRYTNIHQSAGYLYLLGDGSANVITGVNTAGTPLVTTYNNFNVDPQAGLAWRDSLQDYGRAIVIANETGYFEVSGGSVTKISDKLDGYLERAVYPSAGGVQPSSAIATIHNIKHYVNLTSVKDPDTGVIRKVMITFNSKDWTISSQTFDLTYISTQKVGSTYKAWGTDGTTLKPLFDTPSTNLEKRLDTKQYGSDTMFIQKNAQAVWLEATDKSVGLGGISGTFTIDIAGIAPISSSSGVYELPTLHSGVFDVVHVQPNFASPDPQFGLWGTSLSGVGFVTASMRFSSHSADFTVGNMVIGYTNVLAYYGA